ncbi:MAG: hypothetical protein ACREU8_12795 [Gammaproteobacteria bacterium]
MLDTLRKPFFVVAIVLITLTVLLEIGSAGFVKAVCESSRCNQALDPPGFGIPYLALLDGLLLFTIALMGIALIAPARIHGRIQGLATFIVSLLVLIGSIVLIFVALQLLMLMISLLLAVPFGTIVYLATYGDFEVNPARITLSLLMTLKLAFAGFLVFAHQRFLENKGLVLIILTSLLATLIVTFLHGLAPRILVSITDDIAGIVVAILAAIWALVFFLGSIPSIIKALRVDKALS